MALSGKRKFSDAGQGTKIAKTAETAEVKNAEAPKSPTKPRTTNASILSTFPPGKCIKDLADASLKDKLLGEINEQKGATFPGGAVPVSQIDTSSQGYNLTPTPPFPQGSQNADPLSQEATQPVVGSQPDEETIVPPEAPTSTTGMRPT